MTPYDSKYYEGESAEKAFLLPKDLGSVLSIKRMTAYIGIPLVQTPVDLR